MCDFSFEHGRHFGITFLGFNAMSTVFQMYQVDILWNCTAHARENVPCSIAFLTFAITIAMGINPGTPFLVHLYNGYRTISEILKWFVL